MNEKIENSIALQHQTIEELKQIKNRIKDSDTEHIRFKVETKHWYGFSEPVLLKQKSKLNISKYTMEIILDEAIKIARQRIYKLIDMEIKNINVRDKFVN